MIIDTETQKKKLSQVRNGLKKRKKERVKLDKLTGAKLSLDFKVYQAHACLKFTKVKSPAFIILLLHFVRALWQTTLSKIYIQVCKLTWEVPQSAH